VTVQLVLFGGASRAVGHLLRRYPTPLESGRPVVRYRFRPDEKSGLLLLTISDFRLILIFG